MWEGISYAAMADAETQKAKVQNITNSLRVIANDIRTHSLSISDMREKQYLLDLATKLEYL